MASCQRIHRLNVQTPYSLPVRNTDYTRNTLHFQSCGELCEAWLYVPVQTASSNQPGSANNHARPPVVIMGHGETGSAV